MFLFLNNYWQDLLSGKLVRDDFVGRSLCLTTNADNNGDGDQTHGRRNAERKSVLGVIKNSRTLTL